jgi:hypothetical protein
MTPDAPGPLPLRVLRAVLLVVSLLATLCIAPFFAVLGFLGFSGSLADAEYSLNVRAGLQLLGIAVGIWAVTLVCWLWWAGRLPMRFGMRSLLLALTLIAMAVAAVSALLRMPG